MDLGKTLVSWLLLLGCFCYFMGFGGGISVPWLNLISEKPHQTEVINQQMSAFNLLTSECNIKQDISLKKIYDEDYFDRHYISI